MLEVVKYPDMRPELVELPQSYVVFLLHLRSFTQVYEVQGMAYPTELLDQLSLAPTCVHIRKVLTRSAGCSSPLRVPPDPRQRMPVQICHRAHNRQETQALLGCDPRARGLPRTPTGNP